MYMKTRSHVKGETRSGAWNAIAERLKNSLRNAASRPGTPHSEFASRYNSARRMSQVNKDMRHRMNFPKLQREIHTALVNRLKQGDATALAPVYTITRHNRHKYKRMYQDAQREQLRNTFYKNFGTIHTVQNHPIGHLGIKMIWTNRGHYLLYPRGARYQLWKVHPERGLMFYGTYMAPFSLRQTNGRWHLNLAPRNAQYRVNEEPHDAFKANA
jgi:hypothetical protein